MEKTIDEALEYLTDFDLYSPYQEAIDKVSAYIEQMQADYEARLKADMTAMLEELRAEIIDFDSNISSNLDDEYYLGKDNGYNEAIFDVADYIQQKINSLEVDK